MIEGPKICNDNRQSNRHSFIFYGHSFYFFYGHIVKLNMHT